MNFALFFIASWALILSPGPDMLYVITRGISQGKIAGLLSAAGVAIGLLVHTSFAAMGLAVLLQTSALMFLMVKYAGAAYLIFLGIKAIRDKESLIPRKQKQFVRLRTIFIQGILSNVLNPKVAIFFLAFLPQFADSSTGNTAWQMAMLGGIFAICGYIFLSMVGYFSGHIGNWIARKPEITARMRWLTGGILIGLGVRVALSEK